MTARLAPLLLAALVAGLALPGAARAEEVHAAATAAFEQERRGQPWYWPDHATAQLAGNTGFMAAGLGHAWAGEHVQGDLLFGWVPESVGGKDIFSLTAKVTWAPWLLSGHGWTVRPVTLGAQVTYTFGSDYFLVQPSRYPSGYYSRPTALHGGLAVGSSLTTPASVLDRPVSLYYELVALGPMIHAWAENPRTIGPADVFSLALGARVAL